MKKIFLSLLLAGTMLTSCDMNTEPVGVINIGDGIATMLDVTTARNGLYSFLRSRCAGTGVAVSDLQTDLFIGTMQNGNSYLPFTTGNIISNDQDIEGYWASQYSAIMQTNYVLEYVAAFRDNADLTEEQLAQVNRLLSEAHFMRGFFYYQLMAYYCGNYDSATASNPATGIPLVSKYYPTSDRSSYPGRSTLAETYKFIEDDLTEALKGLEEYEKTDMSALEPTGGGYLSSYAVKALQARIALMKGDYTTAETLSQNIIQSEIYPLCGLEEYISMWENDEGDEIIFQPYGDASQRGSVPSIGSIYYQIQPFQVKFSPAANVLSMYNDADARYHAFFEKSTVSYNGSNIRVPNFKKFPGNPAFDSGNTSAQKNLPKPFRSSEQYLILAEAALQNNHMSVASDALNDLREARIEGYERETFNNATALRDQIRLERQKELIGEGFRLIDLRRWNLGFSRDGNYSTKDYPAMSTYIINLALATQYIAGDHRYVWPIPSAEIQTNPQLAGQQNPGY